ncbi:MAG: GtrA family protein [Christensenellales bacterium]
MRNKPYAGHKESIRQLIKFIIVGAVNFFVDFGILALLNYAFGWPLIISNTISYSCGVINSFLLNRRWTFKQKHKFLSDRFALFIIINLISLGVNNLAVHILGDIYGLPVMWAKLIATVFSFTVNFAGNKLFVFNRPVTEENKK